MLHEVRRQLSRVGANLDAAEFGDGWIAIAGTLIVPARQTINTLALLPEGAGTQGALRALIGA